ncbi:MAG TPA: FtsX-like permease family protein [Steroidobacteraceae bacterium]
MEFRPILSAMRRNKFGALLIATQMAVTLGFLANALTLIEQRISWSSRAAGVDELDLFMMQSETQDQTNDLAARQATDVAALRALPGVVDAYAANSYPMQGGGMGSSVTLAADQKQPSAFAALYMGDEHALNTLGLKLIAGRNFTADEVVERKLDDGPSISGVIVTKALAEKVFAAQNALGKGIFIGGDKPVPIIGIVERLQGPMPAATGVFSTFAEFSMLTPYRLLDDRNIYAVRAQSGQRDAVMKAAEAALFRLDQDRILRTKSMVQVRHDAYRGDHGLIVLLSAICAALLMVNAFGILGLTSYWVAQRRQQVGIRRALGATRHAIVSYFQTENLMIASAGSIAGIVFSLVMNLWMVSSFEMVRMNSSRVIIGALVILLLGQLAVLWPALRAASVPPALAIRGG